MRLLPDDRIVFSDEMEIEDGDVLFFEFERLILKGRIGFYTFEEKEVPTGRICGFDYKSRSFDPYS